MRRSAEDKAETRRQIIRKAGRMIRGRGLAETGVAEVMEAAGLTHGGFYRHFASKEDLAAAAIAEAFAEMRVQLRKVADQAQPGHALEAVIDTYLTELHRDRPERGCVMAALGMEAPRAGGAVREAYQAGIAGLLAIYADLIDAPTKTAEGRPGAGPAGPVGRRPAARPRPQGPGGLEARVADGAQGRAGGSAPISTYLILSTVFSSGTTLKYLSATRALMTLTLSSP